MIDREKYRKGKVKKILRNFEKILKFNANNQLIAFIKRFKSDNVPFV